MLYARHIEHRGIDFYRLAWAHDLEDIVAKLKHGEYDEGWFKIRNKDYSHVRGTAGVAREKARVVEISSEAKRLVACYSFDGFASLFSVGFASDFGCPDGFSGTISFLVGEDGCSPSFSVLMVSVCC